MTTQDNFHCDRCGRHDEDSFPTVACKHLVAEPRQFWHAACPTFDSKYMDPWPDALCKQCHQKLLADGGWDGRTQTLSALSEDEREAMLLATLETDRQICNICYEDGMASGMEVAESQVLAPWTAFVDDCRQALADKQNLLDEQYRLSSYERWDCDQTTGQLVFSNAGKAGVVADVEFIGTYSELTNTWLWAWANFDLLENVRSRISSVQEFGDTHALPRLAIRKWSASEEDGWKMAAVAVAVLNARGMYRAPGDHGPLFMAIMDLRHAGQG